MPKTKPTRGRNGIADISHAKQIEVSRAFDVATRNVRKWQCPRNVDGTYVIPAVVAWRVEEAVQAARIEAGADVDPLLVGGNKGSVALERYRTAKAELAEMDAARKREELLPADDVRALIFEFADAVRAAAEQIRQQYGNDPADLLDEALERMKDA